MIGIFDSGLGGLTILKEIKKALPGYSYIYLGDSLRTPYGGRSQEVIYQFTQKTIDYLFQQGCQLVIIACNTASAEALRKLQQEWLPKHYPDRRILGVIRPVVEAAVKTSRFNQIGVVGTRATIESQAYVKELKASFDFAQDKQNPLRLRPSASSGLRSGQAKLKIFQNACPLLVPLVEEGWLKRIETRMIIKKCLRPLKDKHIDTLILGCTHYPLLMKEFVRLAGKRVKVLNGPQIVAEKLVDYLKRHPEIESELTKEKTLQKGGQAVRYLTTDSPEKFEALGSKFMNSKLKAERVELP